jgi:hypothetical protein
MLNKDNICSYYEGQHTCCEQGYRTDKCKGNKFNCIKQKLKDKAIKKLSNREQYKRNITK